MMEPADNLATRPRRRMWLLVGLVLFALIGGIGYWATRPSDADKRRAIAIYDIHLLKIAVRGFMIDHRRPPTTDEFNEMMDNFERELGEPLLDPWGRAYIYQAPGPDDAPFLILTYGADGQPGGEGENVEITSLQIAQEIEADRQQRDNRPLGGYTEAQIEQLQIGMAYDDVLRIMGPPDRACEILEHHRNRGITHCYEWGKGGRMRARVTLRDDRVVTVSRGSW